MQEEHGMGRAVGGNPEWERLALAGGKLRGAFERLDASNRLAEDFSLAAVTTRAGLLERARADVAEANRLLGRT